jgi:glycogen synthase
VRILLLSNLYPPYIEGGAEITAGDIATGLERLGHEVQVLTSSHGLSRAERHERIWRTLRLSPIAHFDRHRPLWQQFDQPYNYYRRYHCSANADELRRAVAATHPDVLYIWEITGIGVNSLLKVLPDLRVPIVFHIGSYLLLYARSPETEQSHLRARRFKQWLIGTVPALTWTSLITVSAAVKQEYVQAGFDPERIEVIYSGIDPRFMNLPKAESVANKEKECFQLLFVGRLSDEKGILVLLKALDLLLNEQGRKDIEKPFLHLNIFGTGDKAYINELETFLHDKRLTQVVTFHGKVPQDELIKHYDQSDIMLMPSLWKEPFGLVAVEAMARELPVIASNVGGPAEILTHEVNGLLIEPGDERALASAIIQLIENPDKCVRLAKAAQVTAQERFTIEENVRRVEQHLKQAIQRDQIGAYTREYVWRE